MILNFNIRQHKDKFFPHPLESVITDAPVPGYAYSVEIDNLPGITDKIKALAQDFIKDESSDITFNSFIKDELLSDFIFDNSDWGSYYPRFEVVLSGDSMQLQPYDFRSAELNGIERRHRIERRIAENVRLQTELKGIRKALVYLINKYGEQDADAVQDFLSNDSYIKAQIAQFPKSTP